MDNSNNPWGCLQDLIVGIIVTVAGGVILAYLLGLPPFGKEKPKEFVCPDWTGIVEESQFSVEVPSTKYWHETNIQLKKGDCIRVTAEGGWWNGISSTGPNGDERIFGLSPPCGLCPKPDGHLGELVGRVNNATPFRIGDYKEQEINQDGILMLAMNENTGSCMGAPEGSCYKDNNGFLRVSIIVRHRK